MTFNLCQKRGKSFGANADSLPAGLSNHNEGLVGDTLTSLFINYEWRRLLSDALQSYADTIIARLDDSLVDDYRNKFQALLDDFYTADIPLPEIAVAIQRNTDQNITANTATAISWNELITQTANVLWVAGTPTKFIIPVGGDGYYSISGAVWFPSTVAAQNKSVRVVVNNLTVYQSNITILALVSVVYAWGIELASGDEIEIEVFCPVAIAIQGDSNGLTTCTIVREYPT